MDFARYTESHQAGCNTSPGFWRIHRHSTDPFGIRWNHGTSCYRCCQRFTIWKCPATDNLHSGHDYSPSTARVPKSVGYDHSRGDNHSTLSGQPHHLSPMMHKVAFSSTGMLEPRGLCDYSTRQIK